MQLKKAIESRKSVRRYSDKKPDWRKIIRAIDAARFAPMAGNTNSIKFVIVSDEKVIKELAEASSQDFIAQAQYVVVAVSDDSQLKRLYPDRAAMFARQQAGAAIENFLLSLNEFGMSTCWIGYFDDRLVKRAVGISDKLVVEAFFPIGFETKVKSNPKTKPELEGLVFFEKYGNKYMQGKVFVSNDAV